jgi:hypothetical protein
LLSLFGSSAKREYLHLGKHPVAQFRGPWLFETTARIDILASRFPSPQHTNPLRHRICLDGHIIAALLVQEKARDQTPCFRAGRISKGRFPPCAGEIAASVAVQRCRPHALSYHAETSFFRISDEQEVK